MDLKDFVSESIKQIIDGVSEAQTYAKGKDAEVNPKNLQLVSSKGGGSLFKNEYNTAFAQNIEFDVAITAGDESKAGGGISVLPALLKIGIKGETAENNSTVSRIKFEVAVLLPNQ